MSTQANTHQDGGSEGRELHPREIWAAVAVLFLGMLVAAAAVLLLNWYLAGAAAALMAIGAILAWHGRIMRNVHARSAMNQELGELEHPDESEGVDPGDSRQVDESGRSRDTSSQSLVKASSHHPRVPSEAPPLPAKDKAMMFGFFVLVAGVWLLVIPWFMVNGVDDRSMTDAHYRDMFVGAVAFLAGLRTILVKGNSAVSAAVTLVAGLGLVLLTLASSLSQTAIRVDEMVVGILITIASAVQFMYARDAATQQEDIPGPTRSRHA